MSVKDEAREAQRREFAKHPEMAEVEPIALGIYDAIDALDSNQRSLLIKDVLGRIHQVAAQTDDLSDRAIISTLAGIGNYTNEVGRETERWTATGDKAVDEVLDGIHRMLATQFRVMLGDRADEVEAAAQRVKARVEAGEDLVVAAREEEDRLRKSLGESLEAPVASLDRSDTGLYL